MTKLSIKELMEKIKSGDLLAVEVCECFQAMALDVNLKLNCVVEPIWEAEVSEVMESVLIHLGLSGLSFY